MGEVRAAAPAPPLSDVHAARRLARRAAALLSLPLDVPPGPASGRRGNDRHQGGESGSGSGGGWLGWLDAATQPWTSAGVPPPAPLQRAAAPAERAAVCALQRQLSMHLALFGTSAASDAAMLQDAAERVARPGAVQSTEMPSHRLLTAVRARLEHKKLLREALALLMLYEQYLGDRFGC